MISKQKENKFTNIVKGHLYHQKPEFVWENSAAESAALGIAGLEVSFDASEPTMKVLSLVILELKKNGRGRHNEMNRCMVKMMKVASMSP